MNARISGLLLCDDLLFGSKITGTAQVLGHRMLSAKTPTRLLELAREHRPTCVLVDLHTPDLDLTVLLAELRQQLGEPLRVVGYGSHVDTATLKAARQAGCDPVWPRSKLVEELPQVLPQWLSHLPSESADEPRVPSR